MRQQYFKRVFILFRIQSKFGQSPRAANVSAACQQTASASARRLQLAEKLSKLSGDSKALGTFTEVLSPISGGILRIRLFDDSPRFNPSPSFLRATRWTTTKMRDSFNFVSKEETLRNFCLQFRLTPKTRAGLGAKVCHQTLTEVRNLKQHSIFDEKRVHLPHLLDRSNLLS